MDKSAIKAVLCLDSIDNLAVDRENWKRYSITE